MHILNDAFQELGFRVCFMTEYFLPDVQILRALSFDLELSLLHAEDFVGLYTPEWSHALIYGSQGAGYPWYRRISA